MKTQLLLSLVLAGSVVASSAFAAEEQQANKDQSSNTSTIKMTDVQKKDEKMKDIDEEITNAKMRAESGSKSKWSVSADLTYSGGNLQTPLAANRPNYAGEAAVQGSTSLDGTIGGSYRVDMRNRVSFGTGISILTPFQSNLQETTRMAEDGGATDISTPYLKWGHNRRIGNVQNSFSGTYSHSTASWDVNGQKSFGAVSFSHVAIFDIEGSNWQPGISTAIGQTIYTDGASATDVTGSASRRQDYSIGLYPFVEYAFNDMFSFRTVFRPFSFGHNRSDDAMTFERSMYTQSMGLGIAITRDVYLYPNMQFAPENLKPELTNVGLSTTLNVF